ncbi:MAG: energy-coupled thiamine transporter ThiT [Halanaerobiaceae bacterium]
MQKNTRILTETGMAIALAVVLDSLTIWKMPYGGSVTLAMLPLFIIAFRWGALSGILAGVGAGFLQLAFGGTIIHPAQLVLDYPLPFGLVGLAGLFKYQVQSSKNISQTIWIFGAMFVGTFFRFITHILSGVIFFAEYAPEGQNVWLYSIIYNGSYLLPSFLLCIIVILPLRRIIIEKR